MRFDRAVRQRGMAAAAGTRRRGGDRGQRPDRHRRCRGMWRCRMAPLWNQVRLAGPGLLGRHRALSCRRRRNRRLPRSRDKGVQPETERHHQRQRERHCPARPAPRRTTGQHHWLTRCGRADLVPQRRTGGGYQPRHRRQGQAPARSLGRRGQQLLQAYCRQRLRRPADRVVLLDQRPGVGPDGLGDAADVPPRVEVAAAPGVVVALNPPDDRFPDPGPLTDLGNGETSSLARFRQSCTDQHAAPPQLSRPAYRPRGQEAGRSRPHHFTRDSCVGRSRVAGDRSGDCTSHGFGIRRLPVPARDDPARGPRLRNTVSTCRKSHARIPDAFATEMARVSYPGTVSSDELIAAVKQAGYTAARPPAPQAEGAEPAGGPPDTGEPGEPDEAASLRQRPLVSVMLTVPVVTLAMVPAAQLIRRAGRSVRGQSLSWPGQIGFFRRRAQRHHPDVLHPRLPVLVPDDHRRRHRRAVGATRLRRSQASRWRLKLHLRTAPGHRARTDNHAGRSRGCARSGMRPSPR